MQPSLRQFVVLVLSTVLMSLCFVGCTESGGESAGWTVHGGALTLEQDLLVSETDSFYFGKIRDLAVASDGRMYVLDLMSKDIKVLGPDGGLQQTIGTAGAGPGEFRRPRQIVLARGDSLFVRDTGLRRVSAYGPADTFAYSVGMNVDGFAELMMPKEPGFLVAHTPLSRHSPEDQQFFVRRFTASGDAGDTLFVAESKTWHSPLQGLFVAVPFSPGPHVALGPQGAIHYARSDSLSVTRYSPTGERQTAISIPFEPVPVTDEEREEALKPYTGKRSIPPELVPSTQPAFETLLVDGEGRYWFGRPTAHDDTTEWWVVLPDEKRVATARLPADIRLQVVRNGYVYGSTSTEAGAPAVVRYRVQMPE